VRQWEAIIANNLSGGEENTWVHLAAAAFAGLVAGSATNPIWVDKTRLQLSADQSHGSSKALGGSLDMIERTAREEGIRGFYKGLSASYLGVTEGTIWVPYEKLKDLSVSSRGKGGSQEWAAMLGVTGTAKCVVSLITYPHEVRRRYLFVLGLQKPVLRTRLRQPAR
jgi:solute carrier family 25 protein 33/36